LSVSEEVCRRLVLTLDYTSLDAAAAEWFAGISNFFRTAARLRTRPGIAAAPGRKRLSAAPLLLLGRLLLGLVLAEEALDESFDRLGVEAALAAELLHQLLQAFAVEAALAALAEALHELHDLVGVEAAQPRRP